ncbi:MAG: hypothetical protein F6K26_06960 [Moorea sp. SIO2I5]|nr:hypothetical protein [Moorena sp. SIO2I5]
MILRVRWNGHLARSAILVEWASGVEQASCLFHSRAGRMPTLLLFSGKIQQCPLCLRQ